MERWKRTSPPIDYGFAQSPDAEIPLTPQPATDPEASVGDLVKQATEHVSTLVRAEIELAKMELTASVKQALKGSIFFAIAAATALFSLWFFWLMAGEILDIWLPRWAAFTIVFGVMLLAAGVFAYLGWRRLKRVKKPEMTISSASATAAALKDAAARN